MVSEQSTESLVQQWQHLQSDTYREWSQTPAQVLAPEIGRHLPQVGDTAEKLALWPSIAMRKVRFV